MKTLLLSPRATEDAQLLWRTAVHQSRPVERLHGWHASADLKGADVCVYGEPMFCANIANELGQTLAVPPQNWLASLPERYVLRKIVFGQLGAILSNPPWPMPWFLKPAADKTFRAQVFQTEKELENLYSLAPGLPVLAAEPVAWEVEFRVFVSDHKIATLSPYSRSGNITQDELGNWVASDKEWIEAREFAQNLISQTDGLPLAVVVDVGIISGRGWAVVEANSACSSGLYGCDPVAVLQVIEKACQSSGT